MFDFNNKKKSKVMLWVIVGVLVACMVLPMAYQLIAALAE